MTTTSPSSEPLLKAQQTNSPVATNKSNGTVNYIDLQVINGSKEPTTKNQAQSIPTASQTISTSPLPTTNIEFSTSNKSPTAKAG